MLMTERFSK